MGGWAAAQPTVTGEKRFVPYLSDPTLLDDSPPQREDVPPADAAAAEGGTEFDGDGDAAANDIVGAHGDDGQLSAKPRVRRGQGPVVSWTKALILAAAVVVIGAFAWYAAQRFVGPKHAEIKFAAVAWLIGMGTATAMVVRGRHGAVAKIVSALAAILAIVLGKALIVCYPEVAAELMRAAADPAQAARAFARLAVKPMDSVFAAVAIMGSAARFILAGREP